MKKNISNEIEKSIERDFDIIGKDKKPFQEGEVNIWGQYSISTDYMVVEENIKSKPEQLILGLPYFI